MSRQQDKTLSTGLCISLLVHGALVFTGLMIYISQLRSQIYQPPSRVPVSFTLSKDNTSAQEFKLGEKDGLGDSIASIDGMTAQEAPQADEDQPFTSLDDPGQNSNAAMPTPPQSAPPEPKQQSLAMADRATSSMPAPQMPLAEQMSRAPKPKTEPAPLPDEPTATAQSAQQPAEQSPKDQQSPEQAATATPTPAPALAAGDPAPRSDSEIDPFAKVGTAEFRSGKTDVQFGRKTKLTRPRVELAGQWDLVGGANPRVVLAIHTNAEGKVTDVAVAKSSGSTNIDQPVRVAAYDWWFEPPRDAAGKAVEDSFFFTVTFAGG